MIDVNNYEGLYYVTEEGEVYRYTIERNGRKYPHKKMIPSSNGLGYLQVGLTDSQGKRTKFYLHRLVWEAFNGTIPEGYEIDHDNEDKTDNRLSNLNLLTRKDNMRKCHKSNPHLISNLINQ